jgi:hypothetical protein
VLTDHQQRDGVPTKSARPCSELAVVVIAIVASIATTTATVTAVGRGASPVSLVFCFCDDDDDLTQQLPLPHQFTREKWGAGPGLTV